MSILFQVCSQHFVDGRPTTENPCPVLNLGYTPLKPFRPPRRRLLREPLNVLPSSNLPNQKEECVEMNISDQTEPTTTRQDSCNLIQVETPICSPLGAKDRSMCEKVRTQMVDKATQWDFFDMIPDHTYTSRNTTLGKQGNTNSCGIQTQIPAITSKLLQDNDYKFYTSLPMVTFLCLVATLTQVIETPFSKLRVHDQLLLVFCRLRLGLIFGDLARRFDVSKSYASRIFKFSMPRMATEMRSLIVWLPRETIQRTMPECFKDKYPFTTCIIDCAEIILERARSHWMRVVTYSNYKGRNTIEFLIAISPNGLIMFVSDCFGGRASDQFITQHSSFFSYLLPGDEIMADRGFLIEDILPPQVKLNVPPFTKGKTQLPEQEVTKGRRVATVRVHVERVIAHLRSKFSNDTGCPCRQYFDCLCSIVQFAAISCS